MNTFYVENLLIKDPTRYRSNKPTCIDYLILTNQKPLFVKSHTFGTTRHGITRIRNTKRLQHTGKLFRKKLQ